MPTRTDYSDYFTITGAPETKAFSHSDSITLSDSFSKSVSIWKTVLSVSVSLTLTDSGLSRSVTTFRSNYSLSDSLTLTDSGLSRDTDTWRHIFSASTGLGLTDSGLSRAISTWRYGITSSDSLGLTDSGLSKEIETWRHIINYNMSLTVSESLSRSTPEWRKQLTKSDAISISDGLDVDVETIIHIRDLSDSLSVAESLGRATPLWFNTFNLSDSLSVADSLNIQIGYGDDQYYYDTVNLSNASTVIGYISSGNFTSSSGLVTGVSGLTDGQTQTPATFSGSNYAGVRFDLGSSKAVNFIACHLKAGFDNTIKLYASNSQGSGYSEIFSPTTGIAQWSVNEFSDISYRYFVLQVEANTVDSKIDEIIIGKMFKPEIREALGGVTGYGSMIEHNESFNGTEYVYQKGDRKTTFKKDYPNISPTLKSNFETLRDSSTDKKFLYSNDGIYYVRLKNPVFNEVAYNRYSTNISLST